MHKITLTAMLFSLITTSALAQNVPVTNALPVTVPSVAAQKVENNVDRPDIAVAYRYLPTLPENLAAYQEAENHLFAGLKQQDRSLRTAELAKAIELISQIYKAEPNSVATSFLAARIYRAYGGLSYAKQYYIKAIDECIHGLAKDVNCRQSHLDLAILYYAGDSRFYADYAQYKEKAQIHAQEVLHQTDYLHQNTGRSYFQAALANLILERVDVAKQDLQLALASGYPPSVELQNVVQDYLNGTFSAFPTLAKNYPIEFLAVMFGKF